MLATGAELGLVEAGPEVFEVLRIEAGTPVFGKDITEKNLPQEIGRDARAINFVKGCYLGQETVARLDALGHVNQILRGLVFEPGALARSPVHLESEGKNVGVASSCAFSPVRNAPVALVIVRTSQMAPGTISASRLRIPALRSARSSATFLFCRPSSMFRGLEKSRKLSRALLCVCA